MLEMYGGLILKIQRKELQTEYRGLFTDSILKHLEKA